MTQPPDPSSPPPPGPWDAPPPPGPWDAPPPPGPWDAPGAGGSGPGPSGGYGPGASGGYGPEAQAWETGGEPFIGAGSGGGYGGGPGGYGAGPGYVAGPGGYGAPPPFGYVAPPPGTYYDPVSEVFLPNGVILATVGRRIGGWFLDFGLCVVTLFIGWIVWSLIVWGQGLTPAKQVLRMRCYRPQDARVASWGYMALRQVVGGLIEGFFSGIIFVVSSIMMITSKDHRALHDQIAGTVVVYDPNGVLVPR